MNIILDGTKMTSVEAAHKYIKDTFGFPDFYGRNLDALYDMLTEICEHILIQISNAGSITANMGDYGENLIAAFEDAAENNANITLEFCE